MSKLPRKMQRYTVDPMHVYDDNNGKFIKYEEHEAVLDKMSALMNSLAPLVAWFSDLSKVNQERVIYFGKSLLEKEKRERTGRGE